MYLTADAIYYDGVKETIDHFSPDVIIANVGGNTFKIDEDKANGRLILNETDLHEIHKDVPEAVLVATHMEAINHYMTSRADLRNIAAENNFTDKLIVPEDGEVVEI